MMFKNNEELKKGGERMTTPKPLGKPLVYGELYAGLTNKNFGHKYELNETVDLYHKRDVDSALAWYLPFVCMNADALQDDEEFCGICEACKTAIKAFGGRKE